MKRRLGDQKLHRRSLDRLENASCRNGLLRPLVFERCPWLMLCAVSLVREVIEGGEGD